VGVITNLLTDLNEVLEAELEHITALKKYKAGVIGIGRIGYKWKDSHYNQYCRNERVESVCLCDTVPVSTHIPIYFNYLEMIKKGHLDIVSVCTPPETHCKIVCDIAPYVKGIYCEKPIATTLEEADKMIQVCHSYGVVLQINHQRRWNKPVFTFSRGIFNSGTHAFDTIDYYFKDPDAVNFVYIDTVEPIFKLEFPAEPHVPPEAIDELLDCIEGIKVTRSSGEDARKALEQCLKLQKSLSQKS
jgi:hypothetical protein